MVSWEKERKIKSIPSFYQWLACLGAWQGKTQLNHLLPAQRFLLWQHCHICAWGCLCLGLPAKRGRKGRRFCSWAHLCSNDAAARVGWRKIKLRLGAFYLLRGLKGFTKVFPTYCHREGAVKNVDGVLHPAFLMTNSFKSQRTWKRRTRKGKEHLQVERERSPASNSC